MTTRTAFAARLVRVTVLAAPLLSVGPGAHAQLRLQASVAGAGDRFAAESGGGYALAGAMTTEYAFGARGRVFYELDAGDFSAPGAWTYAAHRAGGVFTADLAAPGSARLVLGLDGSLRRNGAAWSDADFGALGAMANLELHPAQSTTLRLGYRFDARRFPDLEALDQQQHDAFASALSNLPSRTTLVAEVHLGGKSYAGEPAAADRPSSAAPDWAEAPGGGRRGIAPGWRTLLAPATARTRAGQVQVLARVAQSLAERTGALVQVWAREVWGAVPPVLVTTPPLFYEDGVYDDPFASDAWGWRAAVKHVRPGGAVVGASVDGMRKEFAAALALDADGPPPPGDVRRTDRVVRATASATLPLFRSRGGPWQVDVQARYDYTRQDSNDLLSRYTAHGAAIGLAVRY
jgi:hypothetical protein